MKDNWKNFMMMDDVVEEVREEKVI